MLVAGVKIHVTSKLTCLKYFLLNRVCVCYFCLRLEDVSLQIDHLFCLPTEFRCEYNLTLAIFLCLSHKSQLVFFINNLILNQDFPFQKYFDFSLYLSFSWLHYLHLCAWASSFIYHVFSFVVLMLKNSILFVYLLSNHDLVVARSENRIRMEILIEFKMQTDVNCTATKSRIVFWSTKTITHVLWFLVFSKILQNTQTHALLTR